MDPIAPLQDDTEADSATVCGVTAETTESAMAEDPFSRLSWTQRTERPKFLRLAVKFTLSSPSLKYSISFFASSSLLNPFSRELIHHA